MEPRIVTKPAFTVVGLPFTGFISSAPYEGGNENNEIGLMWDEFNRRRDEIKNICGPSYGLCCGMPNEQEPWYIAGAEVTRVEGSAGGHDEHERPGTAVRGVPVHAGDHRRHLSAHHRGVAAADRLSARGRARFRILRRGTGAG